MDEELLRRYLTPPTLTGIRRALFIQPHPDDNEIGAGGLMAKLAAQGAEVWELTVTDDRADCSERVDGASPRQREALAAMASLGARSAGFLGFADKTDASPEELSAAIVPVLRSLRPDAVFSVDPTLANECHRDHIKVGWAARYAVMDAVCDFYPRLPGGGRHADVWQTALLGQYFTAEPNVIADIGDFWEAKLRAVECHASQTSPELTAALDVQSRWFGARAGFARGEALRLFSFPQLHCFNLPVGGLD